MQHVTRTLMPIALFLESVVRLGVYCGMLRKGHLGGVTPVTSGRIPFLE